MYYQGIGVPVDVAPVRERGLKFCCGEYGDLNRRRRSREGAWIEICLFCLYKLNHTGRSREGAWIEIVAMQDDLVNMQSRSREGAWIEMQGFGVDSWLQFVSLP